MISKIGNYIMIVILVASLSCKKEESNSDLAFSQTCDFSNYNVEGVDKLSGLLRYTDTIFNFPLSGYKFVIESPGRLIMIVCNMPASFEMAKDQSINVTFSGRVVIVPDEVDATNTEIELSYLKVE